MQQVDYLIVGQGVSGSFLAWYLHQAKKSFLIIDNQKDDAASRIASGVINPITGRRFVRTWMIEEIMPFAVNAYQNIEAALNATFIEQKNIINFHTTPQMQLAFEERLTAEQEYLSKVDDFIAYQNYFNFSFGIGEIKPCWWINMPIFIKAINKWLSNNSYLLQEDFEIKDVQILSDEIVYRNIKANKILFCDGVESTSNPWFKNLPFAINKGEAIIFSSKTSLPTKNIFKQGLTITPWQNDLFWIGSTYEWNFDNTHPTDAFMQKVVSTLNYWLKSEFTIEHHVASVRPANVERRPFVGLHPTHPQIGILNGMGAKGCSLAPYFANEFVQHLLFSKPINKLADVNRFSKILQKII